ncbi:MAG: PEP-CTERM sorting domain-containing protein [Planctomycetota bacterium]
MKIRYNVLGAAAIVATAGGAQGQVDKLLIVDLSVANEVTITATSGASAETISGSDSTGVLLADFFNTAGPGIFSTGTGDLTSALNTSDGTPGLFNSSFTPSATSGSFGLNFWTYTDDATSDFVAGSQAFSGSATWTIDADDYAAALAGNASGDIIAFADTDDDVGVVIGTWNLIPAPSSAALLGLGGLAAARRRR